MNKLLKMALPMIGSVASVFVVVSCGTPKIIIKTVTKDVIHVDHYDNNDSLDIRHVLKGASGSINNLYSVYKDDVLSIKGNKFTATNLGVGAYKEKIDGNIIQTKIVVQDKIDLITAPINVVYKADLNVFDLIIFSNNNIKMLANNSPLVKFVVSDGAAVSQDGIVTKTKDVDKATVTVSVGTVSKTFTILFRDEILNKKIFDANDASVFTQLNQPANLPVVWGTTTSLSKRVLEGKKVIDMNMKDIEPANGSGGKKAYATLSHFEALTNKVQFDSTVNFITLRVYVPQEFVNKPVWFRSYWGTGISNGIDLNGEGSPFSKPGWHDVRAKIDHSKFLDPVYTLHTLKIIQLSSIQAQDGTISIEGIYESDK